MRQHLGSKLRYLRERRGLTQVELAPELQLSRSALTSLEIGRRTPRLVSFILRTAAFFNVSTNYLLSDAIPVDNEIPFVAWPPHAAEGVVLNFGVKLQHLRATHNKTQLRLVHDLELHSQAHISLLEAGKTQPSVALVVSIAEYFAVSTDYLLCDALPVTFKSC
jgi:transcriptional regulator with XRE-family HTH domain